MKTTSTIIIIYSSFAAIFVADANEMQPNLKGAVQTATSDEFYNLGSHSSVAVETDNYAALTVDDSSYTYQLRMNLSSPLLVDMTGKPEIDKCIGWGSGISSTNFTWYGISFQLPDDAKSTEGGWNNAPTQPLKEAGYVQQFNGTAQVARYNFTTSADTPVIRARINNGLFWNTFTFDFTDGSNYAERKSQQQVSCIVEETGTTTTYTFVVEPTMIVSLERLSGPAPAPEPSSSSMAGGSFFASTALASSATFLLLL